MYEVNNGTVKISGNYNKESNSSSQFGRDAINNFYSYMEDPIIKDNNAIPPILELGLDSGSTDRNINKMEKYVKENDDYLKSLPPLEFEYRYMPNITKKGDIDKEALFGTAYEELGRRKEVDVNDINQTFGLTDDYTSNPLDINKDGKVDIGEYSTSILAADMFSKSEVPNIDNIDGTINNKGLSKVFEYTQKSNAEAAANLYSKIYAKYNLENEAKKFNP